MPSKQIDPMLTPSEVAEQLGISRLSVYSLLAGGQFPNAINTAFKDGAPVVGNGARYRIPQSDVDRFRESAKVAAA